MRVVQWAVAEDGCELRIPDQCEMDSVLDGFRGVALHDQWTAPEVEVVRTSERGASLVDYDITSLYQHPALTDHGAIVLGGYLSGFGELLRLNSPEGAYYAFNVTNLIDALDVRASAIDHFPDGRWAGVTRYVFDGDLLRGQGIFKLAQLPTGPIFLTEESLRVILESGLRGLEPAEGPPRTFPLVVR